MIATKSIIAYFAIGALSVTAAPSNTFKVERSANAATVFACTEARFTGDCRTIDSPAGQCFNIDAAWNDVISSIQNLERDRFSCKWFEHRDCEGKEYKNQDDADLTDGNVFDKRADRTSEWIDFARDTALYLQHQFPPPYQDVFDSS